MDHQGSREELIEKLKDLVKDVRIAMFTTVEADGSLRSRPMAAQMAEEDADLWFFTNDEAPKVDEVQRERHVNVAFSDNGDKTWMSLSGIAELVEDRRQMEALWTPFLKTWFPKGLDDPDLGLLKVRVYKAEYWDESASPIRLAAGFVKSVVTGERSQAGEGKTVELQ